MKIHKMLNYEPLQVWCHVNSSLGFCLKLLFKLLLASTDFTPEVQLL